MRSERQRHASESTTYDEPKTYSAIAAEYYDRQCHPTCWNFRQASVHVIGSFLQYANISGARVLEVGAGRSIFCDVGTADFMRSNYVAITDLNESMLQYSSILQNLGAHIFTLDAENFTQGEPSYDLIFSSLGDPYNTPKFWGATAARLAKNGRIVFTTPSRKWAMRYRRLEGQLNLNSAQFLLKGGQVVSVSSTILSKSDQINMAAHASFQFLNYEKVPLTNVKDGPISKKVTAVLNPSDEILEGYIFQKA